MEPDEKYLKARKALQEILDILDWVETNPSRRIVHLDLDEEPSLTDAKPFVKAKRFAKLGLDEE